MDVDDEGRVVCRRQATVPDLQVPHPLKEGVGIETKVVSQEDGFLEVGISPQATFPSSSAGPDLLR